VCFFRQLVIIGSMWDKLVTCYMLQHHTFIISRNSKKIERLALVFLGNFSCPYHRYTIRITLLQHLCLNIFCSFLTQFLKPFPFPIRHRHSIKNSYQNQNNLEQFLRHLVSFLYICPCHYLEYPSYYCHFLFLLFVKSLKNLYRYTE
jgi:hypothetical protein